MLVYAESFSARKRIESGTRPWLRLDFEQSSLGAEAMRLWLFGERAPLDGTVRARMLDAYRNGAASKTSEHTCASVC